MKFSLKYTEEILKDSKFFSESVFTGDPIVGVHVRRSDKILHESKLIPLETYISHVDEYFDQLELTKTIKKRRIYLASEDPKIYEEMRTKFPHYEVYSNEKAAKEAQSPTTRYSKSSLEGIIMDIEMLSKCDYVVCTHSSNICRLILENFQMKHVDATNLVKNLDSHYATEYLCGPYGFAIMNHQKSQNSSECDLQVGDRVYMNVGHNMFGEYSIYNYRALTAGLVPSFKVEITYNTYQAAVNFTLH